MTTEQTIADGCREAREKLIAELETLKDGPSKTAYTDWNMAIGRCIQIVGQHAASLNGQREGVNGRLLDALRVIAEGRSPDGDQTRIATVSELREYAVTAILEARYAEAESSDQGGI